MSQSNGDLRASHWLGGSIPKHSKKLLSITNRFPGRRAVRGVAGRNPGRAGNCPAHRAYASVQHSGLDRTCVGGVRPRPIARRLRGSDLWRLDARRVGPMPAARIIVLPLINIEDRPPLPICINSRNRVIAGSRRPITEPPSVPQAPRYSTCRRGSSRVDKPRRPVNIGGRENPVVSGIITCAPRTPIDIVSRNNSSRHRRIGGAQRL